MQKSVSREDIVVGKDILELLGSAMYADPMNVYREYIQNACDSIDEAEHAGLYNDDFKHRIDIDLDHSAFRVSITDNGKGISNTHFKRVLLSFGASKKRGTDARGFRGVGRLAGLGYCQQLIFESRFAGQNRVSKMVWDCVKLKKLLLDPELKLNLAETVEEVTEVTVRDSTEEDLPHFFRVRMDKVIRHGNHIMLNENVIQKYLSQVAPVPFSQEFKFAQYIENELKEVGCFCAYEIYLKDKSNFLTRPHRDFHPFASGMISRFEEKPNMFTIPGVNEGQAAFGWILNSDYFGAFPTETGVGGLRIRSGNIQVGDENILEDCFVENRFNNWAVGEIHLISKKLIPNGRRDNLEHNIHYDHLKAALKVQCNEITKAIRKTSTQRNILKAAAKLRVEAETEINNEHLPVEILNSFKPRLNLELDSLDNYLAFKDENNIHHQAYKREAELIKNCIQEIELVPASENEEETNLNQEVTLSNVINSLKKIGVNGLLIKKFLAEMQQCKLDFK